MAIHERLYSRLADPPRARGQSPALAISRYGARYATRGWFTKLVLFGSYAPALVFCFIIYLANQNPDQVPQAVSMLSQGQHVFDDVASITDEAWYRICGIMLWSLLSIQGWLALFLTPLVGAHQIADDLRSHAFEVYLARPISSWDYLFGKLLVVMRPVLQVMLVPTFLVMIMASAFLEGSFGACWTMFPRVLVAVLIWSLVNAMVILGISSMGKSSRYATIIWFVASFGTFLLSVLLGQTTGQPLFDLIGLQQNLYFVLWEFIEFQPFEIRELPVLDVQREVWPSVVILASLTTLSGWLVMRRIASGRLP